MRRLMDAGTPKAALVPIAEGRVLDATLEVAGKLAAADIQKPIEGSPLKVTLEGIFRGVEKCSKCPSFLMSQSLREHLDIFAVMLDPKAANVDKLGAALQRLEELKVQAST